MKKTIKGTAKIVVLSILAVVILVNILAKNTSTNINSTLTNGPATTTQTNPSKQVTENGIPHNGFKDKAAIDVDVNTNTFYVYEIKNKTMYVFEAESNLMAANGVKEITLNLHSPGGSLLAAHVIIEQINILKEYGIKVHTVVESGNACMSACPLIFLAGDTRTSSGDSVFMFHSPYVQYPYNTPEPVFYVVEKSLRKDREEFANTIGNACPLDKRIKMDIMDHKEHYYTTNQLVTKCGSTGFFTEVIAKPDPAVVKTAVVETSVDDE